MIAENFAQGFVHEVGRRVVAHDALARQEVDLGIDSITDLKGTGLKHALMTENGGLDLLCIFNGKDTLRRLHDAAITDLATRFGVERRLIKHDNAQIAFIQFIDRAAILVQGQHPALEFECFS